MAVVDWLLSSSNTRRSSPCDCRPALVTYSVAKTLKEEAGSRFSGILIYHVTHVNAKQFTMLRSS